MAMTATFVTLSEAKLIELKANPNNVAKFFFEQIEEKSTDSVIDIDKSWHGIHFLLTGKPFGGIEPNCLPILGGLEIGEELSYRPARYLEPEQVRAASEALANFTVEYLRKCYKPAELETAGIYPTGIWKEEGETAFEYLISWYELLQNFYAQAAKRGNAMLLAIM